MLIICLLLFVWLSYSGINKLIFVNASLQTTGKVESLYPLNISFHTNSGKLITFKQGVQEKKYPSFIGEEVIVTYRPDDPDQAEMSKYIWTNPLIEMFWVVMLFLLGRGLRKGTIVAGPLQQKRIRINL